MSDAHSPRPTDLVALVTFDGEVRENQAVTREHLGRHTEHPRPLSAAIEQWLGFGRKTWITVQGRQVHGIATARELSASTAWQVDTLLDAAEEQHVGSDDHVLMDLLRQTCVAAEHDHVTHVLLRTRAGSPAVEQAVRAGFSIAVREQLWSGPLGATARERSDATGIELREASPNDAFGLFQLYSRTLPMEARQALAMTLDEWLALRERRWCLKSCGEVVAIADDRLVGALRVGSTDGHTQLELLTERGAWSDQAGQALLQLAHELTGAREALSLVPEGLVQVEQALDQRGLEPTDERFVMLARRIARTERAPVRARSGMAIPSRG